MDSFLSVIIPAHNRERYLGEAIRSALEQTRPPEEIVVVDDGSTDGTAEVAQSFGGSVRYFKQKKEGVSSARNHGVRVSRGDVLAFLDSDDLWVPQKLEWQLDYLKQHPSTDLLFGQMQSFLSPELDAVDQRLIDTTEMPGVSAGCLLVSRKTFLKIGNFSLEEKKTEFIEWFSRAKDLGCTVHVLPELLLKRRVHASNTVMDRGEMNRHYARVLKSILDRRRAEAKTSQAVKG
jgi:glycosyltransferase involved in cell wall biosynthesis